MKREYETRYWLDNRKAKPVTRGFPKAEAGSAKGAGKIIMQGFAVKVQCVHRPTGNVLWTAKRVLEKGLHVCSVIVTKGEG